MAATCNVTTANRPLPLGFSSIVSVIAAALQNIARTMKHRRDARLLASLDDRMLADIGLTRSDLHDANAEPLWRDPTDLLAGRAGERRKYQQGGLGMLRIDAPSLTPDAVVAQQRNRRTTRHLV